MVANIFPRYTGGRINIEGREGDGSGGSPNDIIVVTLRLNPELIEVGRTTAVTVVVTRNGQPVPDSIVDITSSNQSIGLVPSQLYTAWDGTARFAVIGLATGTANLQASILVEGTVYSSASMELAVTQLQAPVNYAASGYGAIKFVVEPSLADGLYPRPQHLSHQEQWQKTSGTDQGLVYANYYSRAQVTFIPKSLIGKKY